MKLAIFSDIHANFHALDAVLENASQQGCTHFICLGDIVGYNAFPSECLARIRSIASAVVKGNHDEQASMLGEQDGFNPLAEEAMNWTREQLSEPDKDWLRALRLQRQVRDFTIVHATLDTPHKWGYIFNQLDAASSFNYQITPFCFIGHTHSPKAFVRDGAVRVIPFDEILPQAGKKYLVNVGSVGQPRDGDPRAAYVTFDTGNGIIKLHRVTYDVWAAQKAIIAAGLPKSLADRLAVGK